MRDGGSYDYLIVGSGFGGSVAAWRLTEKGYRVAVMEMGKRYRAEDFPPSNWRLRRWLWRPGLGLYGFFNIRPFRHVMILCGNAVGGGSIVYANTLLEPPQTVWQQGSWANLANWTAEMPAHYATARRMLGVTQNRLIGPADDLLRKAAELSGVADTFYRTDVGVFFGEADDAPGTPKPDPYFGGKGPARTTCKGCGGCMVGCRFGAKNTLDQNYLYLAESQGCEIHAETRVVDIRPLGSDGDAGYEVITERSTAWFAKARTRHIAKHVVVAASSLGSMDLLLRLKAKGSLPKLSPRLGEGVRTNSESLIGIRFPGKDVDLSTGIAIGSGVYIDAHTHIEATRYARGSDALGGLATPMVSGTGKGRIVRWLGMALRHPLTFLRMSLPFGFARQTLILLVMQALDATLRMRLRRRWYWPFTKLLCSEGQKIPTNIPQANEFALKAAKALGGTAMTTVTEVLFDMPMTAHCIGGCNMGPNADEGVIDAQHRAYGYHNLYIVDGSAVGANLGVNPSLTITALAERAMALIPEKPPAA